MKNYTKKEAIKIIVDAAAEYDKTMNNNRFLIAYQGKRTVDFSLVAFKKTNFKHFTGVETDLSPKDFYKKAISHKLSPADFEFDEYGNAQRKLWVLPFLSNLFFGPALYGIFNRSGLWLEADYVTGDTKGRLAIAFREGEPWDFPVSLYSEDAKKLMTGVQKVVAIWRSPIGSDDFEITYCDDHYDTAELLKVWKGDKA